MAWAERLAPGKYRAGWRDPQGRRRYRSPFSTAKAAKAYGADQERHSVAPSAAMTWAEWMPLWLAARTVEASTRDAELPRLNKWLLPRWGPVPLGRIRRSDIQAWVAYLSAEGVTPASVQKLYYLLSASLRTAVAHEIIPASPCQEIALPTPGPGHERFLTWEEFVAVLYELDEPYRTAVAILAGTGLRFGEMAGLHWQRVELTSGQLQIVETWAPKASAIKAYPKGRRQRAVPLPDWVALAIGKPNDETSCGQRHLGSASCRSGLVIVGPSGAPLDAHNMRARHWIPALRRAGVAPARQHDLRHSYASWLVQSGTVPIEDIAAALGHTSTVVTRRYSHLGDSYLSRVRAALNVPSAPAPLQAKPGRLRGL